MIGFLIKGLFRDRHRSLFPVLTVSLGVMLTVLMHCFITGMLGDMIDLNARFSTGHVKVITRAYADNMDQLPNDLSILEVGALSDKLSKTFPEMNWVKRIRFGGLIDVPDEKGETRSQGPGVGLAVDLLSGTSQEIERLNLAQSIIRGHLPGQSGEIMVSDDFAAKLGVKPGDSLTIMSSTMYGSMAMENAVISGTVRFGVQAMDRGAFIMDIKDAQKLLDMEDASGEILGYFKNKSYDDKKAEEITERFKMLVKNKDDEFSPVMLKLKDQNDLAGVLDYVSRMTAIFVGVFLAAMSIVLWNSGLLGGLRRYGEVGVRIAFGESKGHVYRSMIMESLFIGFFGSLIGAAIGLIISYFIQVYGLDFSSAMKNATIMMPSVFRTQITPPAYFIGLVPGLISTVLGTSLAGIGVYKRNTAQLFKELEQ